MSIREIYSSDKPHREQLSIDDGLEPGSQMLLGETLETRQGFKASVSSVRFMGLGMRIRIVLVRHGRFMKHFDITTELLNEILPFLVQAARLGRTIRLFGPDTDSTITTYAQAKSECDKTSNEIRRLKVWLADAKLARKHHPDFHENMNRLSELKTHHQEVQTLLGELSRAEKSAKHTERENNEFNFLKQAMNNTLDVEVCKRVYEEKERLQEESLR